MIFYSVNIGHFDSFNEALEMRKRKFGNNGYIFNYDGVFTVKIFTTSKKEEAERVKERLGDKVDDVWIAEKSTSVNLKGA